MGNLESRLLPECAGDGVGGVDPAVRVHHILAEITGGRIVRCPCTFYSTQVTLVAPNNKNEPLPSPWSMVDP